MNPSPDLRAALKALAEAAPPGSSVTFTVPREALLELVNGNEAASGEPAPRPEPERLLNAEEVSQRLGTSVRWVYDHAAQLGAHHLSRRCVRFPEASVRRAAERRR